MLPDDDRLRRYVCYMNMQAAYSLRGLPCRWRRSPLPSAVVKELQNADKVHFTTSSLTRALMAFEDNFVDEELYRVSSALPPLPSREQPVMQSIGGC